MRPTRIVLPFWQLRRHATTSGPHGVDGRSPRVGTVNSNTNQAFNQVSITDPFVLYQNHVSRGTLQRDEEIGRASCRKRVDLGGRRIIKKKHSITR